MGELLTSLLNLIWHAYFGQKHSKAGLGQGKERGARVGLLS